VRLEEKPKVGTDGLTSPRSCSVGAMRMLRLERTGEKLMRMVALCADVEEAELEQVAVVEEVVRRVAVVDGELSRSPMVRSRTGSRGRTRKRHGGGVTETTPETKTATRRGSRRESRCRNRRRHAIERHIPGFARPVNASGTMARTGVAKTGRARESAPPRRHCLRDQQRRPPRRSQAQKNGEEEDADAARSCWSRRRGRSGRRRWRRGGAGRSDEVTPDDLAQGLMIRRTRRRSSKKATKNSNSSVKTMCAQGAH